MDVNWRIDYTPPQRRQNLKMIVIFFLRNSSDKADFWLNDHVNKYDCRFWSENNPHEILEKSLHSANITVTHRAIATPLRNILYVLPKPSWVGRLLKCAGRENTMINEICTKLGLYIGALLIDLNCNRSARVWMGKGLCGSLSKPDKQLACKVVL